MKFAPGIAGVLLWLLGSSLGIASASDVETGVLPPGAISVSDMSGVKAEICRDHLFDPASVHLKLPAGYRIRLAAELAASDPALAELIKLHPPAKAYAVGSLCLMSFTTFIIDGVPVNTAGAMPAAFWWVAAEGPLHADMRGKARWVQIGSWYPEGAAHSKDIRRTDPMAQFAKMEVEQVTPDDWRLRLVLATETIEADVHATSPSKPRNSGGPGYMSVPLSGDSAGYFSVFAYAGHRIRDVTGNWRASGKGVFTAAFAIPNEAGSLGTVFEEGWTARSGLYRFGKE